LILAATAGTLGCDTEARRQRRAEEARRNQEWEDGQRREAETAPPTPEMLEQVRAATAAFLEEHHAELHVEGVTLTPLTPNLFLVGAEVKDLLKGNTFVAQLTAERPRDVDWEDDDHAKENGRLLWMVDYATAEKMQALAQRHGFGAEVDRIRDQDREGRYHASWGHRSWLDDYLLWHFLFHRPSAYGFRPGGAFTPMPSGYRFQDPGHPIGAEDVARFQGAAAPTGGRSMVFLGGSAWRPPLVSGVGVHPGQAFVAGPHGSISGKAAMGSVGRGGFGHAGHASGSGG
jgi:hypothetical protein